MDTCIVDYGAQAGSRECCTTAIQRAIDACAAGGGGRVTVPAGEWLTGTVWLRSHVELHLAHGARLLGSTDLADYNAPDAYEQNYGCAREGWAGKHLIIAHEAVDVALTGTGTVDGNGGAFLEDGPSQSGPYIWRDGVAFNRNPQQLRPGQMVCFVECENVVVRDVFLTHTPCWGLFLLGCENVTIRGVRIVNPAWFKNSDGIDVDSCRYVTISDCVIDTGDDAIAIRGECSLLRRRPIRACSFVTVTNCVLASSSSAFRVGVGDGAIRHVRVSNIAIHRAGVGIQFQTDYAANGAVDIEDVCFADITADGVGHPVVLQEHNGASVRHIRIDRCRFRAMACVALLAAHTDTVWDIALRQVEIAVQDSPFPITPQIRERRGNFFLECENIQGLQLADVQISATEQQRALWRGERRLDGCTEKV